MNPRANNTMGNIIRWKENGDFAGTSFAWNHFVLAGDPSLERADAEGQHQGRYVCLPHGGCDRQPGVLLRIHARICRRRIWARAT